MIDQTFEASVYSEAHKVKIEEARRILAKASTVIRPIIMCAVIGESKYSASEIGIIDSAWEEIGAGNFDPINVIRGLASTNVSKACKSTYWDFTDTINFFHDATGTHWRYFTQEKREISLQWAIDSAQEVIAMLDTKAPESIAA